MHQPLFEGDAFELVMCTAFRLPLQGGVNVRLIASTKVVGLLQLSVHELPDRQDWDSFMLLRSCDTVAGSVIAPNLLVLSVLCSHQSAVCAKLAMQLAQLSPSPFGCSYAACGWHAV